MDTCIAKSISNRTALLLNSLEQIQFSGADFKERRTDYGTFTTSYPNQEFRKSKSDTDTDPSRSHQDRPVGGSGEKIPRVMTRPPPMVMAKIPEGKLATSSTTTATGKSRSLSTANQLKFCNSSNHSGSSNNHSKISVPPGEGFERGFSTECMPGHRPTSLPYYDNLYTSKYYQPTASMLSFSAKDPLSKNITCNSVAYPRDYGFGLSLGKNLSNSYGAVTGSVPGYVPSVYRPTNVWTCNPTPPNNLSDKYDGIEGVSSQQSDVVPKSRPKTPASRTQQKGKVNGQNKGKPKKCAAIQNGRVNLDIGRAMRTEKAEQKGQQALDKKSGPGNPDHNNNFYKGEGGIFFCNRIKGPKEDEELTGPDRINLLAKPKRYPCTHRRCCEVKRITPEAMQRIESLAQPKLCHYTVCSCCQSPNCLGECTTKFRSKMSNAKDAAEVDWDRLATPRKIAEPDPGPPRRVQSARVTASAHNRIEKLSIPRKQINSGEYYVWLRNKKPDTDVYLKRIKRLSVTSCDLKDARVLLRCDFDFTTGKPIDDKVRDTIPTMQLVLKKEVKSIVIISRCGPEGIPKDPAYSLEPLAGVLEKYLETRVIFLDDCVGFQAQALCEDPVPGSVFLLENLSFKPEELGYVMVDDTKVVCKKEDVNRYQKIIADHGDIYISDSFSELIQMTNTTTGFPPKPFGYGTNIKKEISVFQKFAVHTPVPVLAIVSGPFQTTWTVIRNLMGKVGNILVGGMVASVILKAIKNIEIGTTEYTPKMEKKALKIFSRAKDTGTTLHLPSDFVVRHTETNEYFVALTRGDVDKWFEIVDIGPHTRKCYIETIKGAAAILWLGDFGPLTDGTEAIKEAYIQAAKTGTPTYAADDIVKNVIGGVVSKPEECLFVTGNGETTAMLLKGQIPKGLAIMSKKGRKLKRQSIEVERSYKPESYELPGMAIAGGAKSGEPYEASNSLLCINHVSIQDKRVLIRVEFNEPMTDNAVTNNYRMRMTIPTIKYALKWRARAVVILAHFREPKGRRDSALTLKPICDEMASLLGETVVFVPRTIGKDVMTTINVVHPGSVLMLENVRFHPEEEQGFMGLPDGRLRPMSIMTNPARYLPSGYAAELNAQFCEDLTRLGDVYVNDAFGALHLDHSSITGNFRSNRVCGFLVKNELKYLAKLLNYPTRNFLVILGGTNIEDKLNLLPGIFKEVDSLILAGTMACLFLKVEYGLKTGKLIFSKMLQNRARELVKLAAYHKCRMHYPVDLAVSPDPAETRDIGDDPMKLVKQVSVSEGIPPGYIFVDIGNLSASMFTRIIKRKQMIFWTGVPGNGSLEYEHSTTKRLLEAVYSVTHDSEKGALTIVGGRGMSQIVEKYDPEHEAFTHLTTGGRTALELLANRHVVGLDALLPKPGRRPMSLMGGQDYTEFREAVVLVRCDLDLPMDEGVPLNTFPLQHLVETIKFIQKRGPAAIILVSQRGHPDGQEDETLSMEEIKPILETALDQAVVWKAFGFTPGADGPAVGLPKGSIILTENIGFKPAEAGFMTTEAGDRVPVSHEEIIAFRSADIDTINVYVNESFATINRAYSSVVGISRRPCLAGPSLKKQIYDYIDMRRNYTGGFLLILGAEEVEDIFPNLLLLYTALDVVESVFLCGLMSAVFQSSAANSAKSQFQDAQLVIPRINHKIRTKKVTLNLVTDAYASKDPSDPEEETRAVNMDSWLARGYARCDMGPNSINTLTNAIKDAKLIALVGPTGSVTYDHHNKGTKGILDQIAAVTSDGSATAVALGMRTGQFIHHLGHVDSFNSYSVEAEPFFDIILRRPLAGLQVLDRMPVNLLKKLSMEQMHLEGQRVLMRLDLDVPSVEGVVLDTDKLEDAAPSIQYALNNGAKCVIILGHRGEPMGYKNYYLRMEPLVVEISAILGLDVNFIDRPCSKKAKKLLQNPPSGSVFLMENLKFYPAEMGHDAEPRNFRSNRKNEDSSLTGVSEISKDETIAEELIEAHTTELEEQTPEAGITEEEDDEDSISEDEVTVSDGQGGRSVDSLMYQLMRPKTVEHYIRDLAACGDVFINDDVAHVEEPLTSFAGFGIAERGCGLMLAEFLKDSEEAGVYNLPGVENLSPAP